MSVLSELAPQKALRVMDLVRDAGVDVSDWANFKGGKNKAPTNPKYCYEWSFVQPHKVVVLNVWHRGLKEDKGVVYRELNMRKSAQGHIESNRTRRAWKMDQAILMAFRENLPVRVIVCDGKMRERNEAISSLVKKRLLDNVPWFVQSYNDKSGECILRRGIDANGFVDQFSIEETPAYPVARREVTSQVFQRSAEVRRRSLQRAKGCCEWCDQPGFKMEDGSVYLETHHVISLADNGPDVESNVAALCPNHHREAHYGEIREQIKRRLLSRLASASRKT